MIVLTVYYPYTDHYKFDLDYYVNVHLPLVVKLLSPELKGRTIDKGVSTLDGSGHPSYVMLARLEFDSRKSLESALAKIAPVADDIAKFTNIKPYFEIEEEIEDAKFNVKHHSPSSQTNIHRPHL
jgi:uncharacterized protein (TIGR02118 family)